MRLPRSTIMLIFLGVSGFLALSNLVLFHKSGLSKPPPPSSRPASPAIDKLWSSISTMSKKWRAETPRIPRKPQVRQRRTYKQPKLERPTVGRPDHRTSFTITTFPSPWNPYEACFDIGELADELQLPSNYSLPAPYWKKPLSFHNPPKSMHHPDFPAPADRFACLPLNYIAGTAKAGTTHLWGVLLELGVVDTTHKEQDFWNIVSHHVRMTAHLFAVYARRYGYYSWERVNLTSVDDSPLYWGVGVPHLLGQFAPEARVAFVFRHPLDRALSCYRYFCQQQPDRSNCTSEDFEWQVQKSIAASRQLLCQGQKAAELQKQGHFLSLDFALLCAGPPTEVWPLDEPDLVQAIFEPLQDILPEGGHQCAVVDNLLWIPLAAWLRNFPPSSLANFFLEELETEAGVEEVSQFLGLGPLNERAKQRMHKPDNQHKTETVVMLPVTFRKLERIFLPHLRRHEALLKDLIT